MKLTVGNTKGKNVQVYDKMGSLIPWAFSFNTKTCRIGFYVPVKSKASIPNRVGVELDSKGRGRAKKVFTVWRGAYAKLNGVRL